MTRLHYWLTANTQYNIHSPFLFSLYEEVLFARIPGHPFRKNIYPDMVLKFSLRFGLQVQSSSDSVTIFCPSPEFQALTILNHPYADKASRSMMLAMSSSADYNVVLDLYDVALFICRPSMAPQRYLLK